MSFQEFPDYMYEIVNTGGLVELGTYTINNYKQISNITVTTVFYRTDLFTTERVRLSCDRSSQSDTITSNWFTPLTSISDFTDQNHWIGNIRFDFARENLQDSDTLKLFLETSNYTHSQAGTQIGAIINYLDTVGAPEVNSTKAAYSNVFGYE